MIQPGDTIGFQFLGIERRGIVASVYTCDDAGFPTELDYTHSRYFVLPIVAGVVSCGLMLVMPADCPVKIT